LTPRERAEGLLAVGAEALARPDWPSRAATFHPLTWSVAAPAAAHAASPTRSQSTLFRQGGYVFLEARTADRGARQLVFDVGNLGYLPNAAHEHADALSILVRVNETLVIADPGTGTYTASPTIRNGFRSTASHNTITIDDLDQADTFGTFKWLNMTRTEVIDWEPGAELDYVRAAHAGYERLRMPVRHTRAVLFVRPEYWIVVDRIDGRGEHRVRSRFHFPPDVTAHQRDATTFDARAENGDGVRLTLLGIPGQPASRTTVERSPWSAGYNRWETSSRLSTEVFGGPDLTFLTLITPLVGGHSRCEIARVESPTSAVRTTVGDDERVLCRMRSPSADGEDVLMIRRRPGTSDGAGEIVFVRRTNAGAVERSLGPIG
jgi:heparinase II/III-like protein